MKLIARLLFAVLVFGFFVPPAEAQIPRLLSFQGVLTDTAGNPRPDGSYSLTFRLYAGPTGGSALWTETKTLSVERGLFSTILGDSNPFGSAVTFEQQYWLSIQVASQPQMSPRIPLTSVGYSLNSMKADTARYARSAPSQPSVDSARVSGKSHLLHLPSQAQASDPENALRIENLSTGDGIRAYSKATAWNYAALFGANTAGSGSGTGVYGYSMKGAGVYANSQDYDGLEAVTTNAGKSAVFAHSDAGTAATCRSVENFGVRAGGGGDASWTDLLGDLFLEGSRGEIFTSGNVLELYSNGYVAFDLDNDNNGSNQLEVWNGAEVLVFRVDESGNTYATGTKSAKIHTDTHGDRLVYATESPGVWLEDFGSAVLRGGTATVGFEEVFAQTINTAVPYHVFLTANADPPVVLSIARKDEKGFVVKGVGLDGRPVDCSCDYRIVAKRRGYESVRMAVVDPSDNSRGAIMPGSPAKAPHVPVRSPLEDKN